MILKRYQSEVVDKVQDFFTLLDEKKDVYKSLPKEVLSQLPDYLSLAYSSDPILRQYPDRPQTGVGQLYPRVCIKMPTGGGKTLVAIETIRAYQNLFAKKRTGLVVWITHRESIYRQTIENMQNKSHVYRQLLDQCSGNKTLILEKGQPIRQQDTKENLVVLMLMIQSARRDTNKIFEDSGAYTDFFPPENRYDLHEQLAKEIPNLDVTDSDLFSHTQVKTSLGNVIRTLKPLVIVDEFHTMFTPGSKQTLDRINPSAIVGFSATPKAGMNILTSVSGQQLNEEDMIKLDLHLIAPQHNGDWQGMLGNIKNRRDDLEKQAIKYEKNTGIYIRPIALVQVERTGREQRGQGFVHSEDVREGLIALGVPKHEIAVKSSTLDEIREEKLLSKQSEIRYIITKEALKEGWDCSFAYILGVIPNSRANASMTQLVGRILRQPYAKKTGVQALDESYVYFSNGQAQEVLEYVRNGFKEEGLSDVLSGVKTEVRPDEPINPSRLVAIKEDIKSKYYKSLFLPVWLTKEGKEYRPFMYESDIKPLIDWSAFDIEKWVKSIQSAVTSEQQQLEHIIGLDEVAKVSETKSSYITTLDTSYLTRRITDVVENAFLASDLSFKFTQALLKTMNQEALDENAGFVSALLVQDLQRFKRDQEKTIFERLLSEKVLKLAVSDSETIGFRMPEKDTVSNQIPSAYRYCLYDDIEISSLNSLEKKVVDVFERNNNVIWWARNKSKRDWYSIQGWQKGKIRPDFVVAKKSENGNLEFVYVVESKGEQLLGNRDTEYKNSVFEKMNDLKHEVETLQFQTTTYELNDKFEFELIPQGDEEKLIRSKLG